MANHPVGRDDQWELLLTRCYGNVEPDADFRSRLLGELKARIHEPGDEREDATGDGLEADPHEAPIRTLIAKAYVPIEPDREFQTRLLANLKRRQKTTVMVREHRRRRSIFSSVVSSLAAAAVLFVVWLVPLGDSPVPGFGIAYTDTGDSVLTDALPASGLPERAGFDADPVHADSFIPNAASSYDKFSVDAAFASSPLPKTVGGVGMELDVGGGWRAMGATLLTRISPGMAFRSTSQTAGLVFDDGSFMRMLPQAMITATENGFSINQGEVVVTVPGDSRQAFRLHFPERDIAVEPGTDLAVNVPFPGQYAEGGAPAPVVKVFDGGLAMARGRNGVGPLLANQAYLIDNYVTPDLPGRPLYATEYAELLDIPPSVGFGGGAPGQLVSSFGIAPRTPEPQGFWKVGGKWVAQTYSSQPLTRIQYLSDAYFGLASKRRDLASALAVGPNAIIDAGDGVFYEIYR